MLKFYCVICNVALCADPTLSFLNSNMPVYVKAESEEKARVNARDSLYKDGYCSVKIISCKEIPKSGG